ncbi:hypothetical protein C5167_035422 [Papaver somniferum]|uniref:Uncharacterized protein n=1 Tax=Papaver somniferum TaxID=3469 RepID=A0A4Y7KH26_PAPSO|nr:hypothetical protein C5167_035422 [Papaver somniferum]
MAHPLDYPKYCCLSSLSVSVLSSSSSSFFFFFFFLHTTVQPKRLLLQNTELFGFSKMRMSGIDFQQLNGNPYSFVA